MVSIYLFFLMTKERKVYPKQFFDFSFYSFDLFNMLVFLLYLFFIFHIKVGLQIDAPTPSTSPMPTIDKGQETTGLPNLPKPLTLEEKKFLLAVERGDLANVRR